MFKNPLLGKFLFIAVVVVGAFLFGFPPKDRINLGLDLRGGAHILMQVDTESAVEYQVSTTVDWLGNRLKDKGLTYDSVLPTGEASLEVRGTDTARASEVRSCMLIRFWLTIPLWLHTVCL